jgi:hypothetical protein
MAAKVMGLLRPEGLRLRDSSVQPFVLADVGRVTCSKHPSQPLEHRGMWNSSFFDGTIVRLVLPRPSPGAPRSATLSARKKVSDATYIPVTRTGGTCGNGSCRRDDERRKCELLLWQGDAAMLQMEGPET